MKELVERLITLSFADYEQALSEIRKKLDTGYQAEKLEDADFFFLLRPYCWFLHDPGFQDILDLCEASLQAMMNNKDLLMEETNVLTGNEFLSVGTFLASYVDEGDYNPSEWKMLFSSPEVAVHTTAVKYSEILKDKDSESSEILLNLANLFFRIEGSKHDSYYILRHIGADYLPFLETLIYRLPQNDQTFVLHALDAFPGNKEVMEFYKRYITEAQSEHLRELAEKYLNSIQ